MSRIASAPAALRLDNLVAVDDEVLAQHRQVAGGARRARIRQGAPKNGPSVRIESACAPPAV